MLTFYGLIFIFGAILGSFINVVGLRFLRNESIIPRSYCYHCCNRIKPYDNIPVLSWIILGGKCRSCKQPISIQYPLIELITGLLFVATVYQFGFTWQTAFLLFLIFNFMVILITDFREKYIYDINSIGLIPFGLVYTYLNLGQIPGQTTFHLGYLDVVVPDIFISALIAVAGALLVFFALNLYSKLIIGQEGFGLGDAYLLVGIGSFFGLKIMLLIFLVSFLIQAAIGIPMTFYLWIKNRIFKPALLTLLGFILVSIPYILQLVIPSSSLLLIITLGLGAIAVYCSIKALKIVKSNGLQFHGIPFGPTIVLGCLLMVFFEVPILSFFRLFLPV